MTTTVTPTDMKINYQSDFDFIYRPRDLRGEPVDFPPQGVDWRVEFATRDHCRRLTVQCTGGVCMNCFNDNGRIHVVAKDHGLAPGRLVGTMTLLNPNRTYPGGIQRIVDRQPVGIELVTASACYDDPSPTADVVLPIVAVDGRQPLPFMFGEIDDIPMSGLPVFDREQGRFFRPNENRDAIEIDPADAPYNIYAADGRVIANTDRLFICGHTVYRHTGRGLVNVAIEQNPDQRLVARTPSINAHPGLVYLDRGFIRLPVGLAGTEVRVSLKDMYLQRFDGCGYTAQADGLIPLIELSRHFRGVSEPVVDGDTLTYTVESDCSYMRLALHADQIPGPLDPLDPPITILPLSEDGDAAAASGKAIVKPGGTGVIGGIVRPPVTSVSDIPTDDYGFWPGNRPTGGYIGVRCDSQGRTIFYRFRKAFTAREVMPPSLADVDEALMRLYPRRGNYPDSLRDETWGNFRIGMQMGAINHRRQRLQIEVWKRKRLRWRRDKENRPVARWKWRRVGTGTRIGARNCLIRARRLVGTARSPWVYFNVALMKHGRIYPAAQVRL